MSIPPRLLPLLLALALPWAVPATAATPLRVMTFNVRLPVESDAANYWDRRRDLVVETIRHEDPDLIGTQELVGRQGAEIIAALPRYAWFGAGRRGSEDDEHMGVFYRTDRLRVLASGDFWLSDTPGIPGSISWGNLYPRLVTWARFQRIADGATFSFYNTHLPYRDEDESARVKAAQLILSRLRALPATEPVIVTGDFNSAPDSGAYRTLTSWLADAWTAAPRHCGPEATFHDFTGTPDRRIDWILSRNLQATTIRTVTRHRGAHYPSDHFPVVAEFIWPREPGES
jgi:endonuclease/exonuclease/phosphatase family metal-dependent hydrolase